MKKKLVVLTGAGISKESGIDTFRDSKNGLWGKHKVKDVAHVDALHIKFDLVMDFYNEMRRKLKEVQPNKAHYILKELENYFDVHIITQNVDDLHERAGSKNVLHLHGEITKKKPMDNGGYIVDYVEDIFEGDVDERDVQYRPNIVMFGEPVPNMKLAIDIVSNCDYFLIVGTSLEVYPANTLDYFVDRKAIQYSVNTEKADNMYGVEQLIFPATEGMEVFKELILEKVKFG